jgi:membrane-associated protease RseP (regulator of RpoE activity)
MPSIYLEDTHAENTAGHYVGSAKMKSTVAFFIAVLVLTFTPVLASGQKGMTPPWRRLLFCMAILFLTCASGQSASQAPASADPIQALDKALGETDATRAAPPEQRGDNAASQVKRPYFGMAVQPVPPIADSSQTSPGRATLLITSVATGSPAQQSGLQQNDVITEINGRRFEDATSMVIELGTSIPEKEMQVTIMRNNESAKKLITPLAKQ